MKVVGVVFGGKSCEHDISCITGVLTLNNIDRTKYIPFPIYVTNKGEMFTGEDLFDISLYKNLNYKKLKKLAIVGGTSKFYIVNKRKIKEFYSPYAIINCMHGVNGEDGAIKGFFNILDFNMVGANLFSSSGFIDKEYTKLILSSLKIKKLDYVKIKKQDFYEDNNKCVKEVETKINYPVIIKPARLGSSIGIKTANDRFSLINGLRFAFKYDLKVIVEKKLEDFAEINCAVYRGEKGLVISKLEKPFKSEDILSFKDKYVGYKGGTDREFPAKVDVCIKEKIEKIVTKIYNKLEISGVIRIDFIVKDNQVYVNEVNTIPGSLSCYLFSDTMKGFREMLTELIENSYRNYLNQKNCLTEYKSNILNITGIKGNKLKRD